MENYVQKVSDLANLDDGKIYASIFREMANVCSTIDDVKHYCEYNYPQYCNYSVADMNQEEAYETYDEMYWAGFLNDEDFEDHCNDEDFRPSDYSANPEIYEAVYQHHFENIMVTLNMDCIPNTELSENLERKMKNAEKRREKMEEKKMSSDLALKMFDKMTAETQLELWKKYMEDPNNIRSKDFGEFLLDHFKEEAKDWDLGVGTAYEYTVENNIVRAMVRLYKDEELMKLYNRYSEDTNGDYKIYHNNAEFMSDMCKHFGTEKFVEILIKSEKCGEYNPKHPFVQRTVWVGLVDHDDKEDSFITEETVRVLVAYSPKFLTWVYDDLKNK